MDIHPSSQRGSLGSRPVGASRRPVLALPAATLCLALLGGCMQARMDESREMQTKIASDEAVVILASRRSKALPPKTASWIASAPISPPEPQLARARQQRIRRPAVPGGVEPGTAPTRPEGVTAAPSRPGVSERVAETGVRYVLGSTAAPARSTAVAASPAALRRVLHRLRLVGEEAAYEATIWDIKQAEVGGLGRHQRHRHLGDHRRGRAAAVHRTRRGHGLQPARRTVAHVLPGRRRSHHGRHGWVVDSDESEPDEAPRRVALLLSGCPSSRVRRRRQRRHSFAEWR